MKTRICVEDETGVYRKVALVGSNASGFFMVVPYHSARKGFFHLSRVKDVPGVQAALPSETFLASSRAKLSFHPPNLEHPDTFVVHFSGDGIISGFDEAGRPKGLSLKGPPMEQITTGPTFGLIVWGLADFDKAKEREKDVLRIQQSEMFPRQNSNGRFNAYNLEVFLLPNSERKSKTRLPVFFKKYTFEGQLRGFYLKVIELPFQNSFLGITCIRRTVGFSAKSGYNLSSPRLLGWMINGMYPEMRRNGHEKSLDVPPNSLDPEE